MRLQKYGIEHCVRLDMGNSTTILSISLALILLGSSVKSSAQELPKLERDLMRLHEIVMTNPMQAARFAANDSLIMVLEEALIQDRDLDYAFDSLESISIIEPDDGMFRLFTWFVREQSGEYRFYGVMQSWNDRYDRYDIHWLKDESDQIENPQDALLDANHWYGALYYDVIPLKKSGRTYYTLLGWDGHNNQITRKLIEVLSFHRSGSPVFGYYLFRNMPERSRRIVFEYSARASMVLRFDEQSYTFKKRKRNRKIKVITARDEMIVFDRLVPMEPGLNGNPRFTVPESNIQDALILKNGRWELLRDIDARNPEKELPEELRKKPEQGLFPPGK